MKKILSLFFILMFLLNIPVLANDIIDSGVCGNNATWTLYSNGELIIKGTGNITKFEDNFYEHVDLIKTVTILDGIVTVSEINDCKKLEKITFPDTVMNISGFNNCGISEICLPINTKEIHYAFNDCNNLKKIYIPKK